MTYFFNKSVCMRLGEGHEQKDDGKLHWLPLYNTSKKLASEHHVVIH